MISPPEEGFVLASENVLSEPDPAKVVWELRPDGEHGPGVPPPANPNTTIAEEWHVMPMDPDRHEGGGFFAVFRTTLGILGATWTADGTARTGWATSTYAAYDLPAPASQARLALKNPRGPTQLKRFSNGQFLLLFYNNGETGYAQAAGATRAGKDPAAGLRASDGIISRNPYWLATARPRTPGSNELVFSQPEIALYMRDYATARFGPGSVWGMTI